MARTSKLYKLTDENGCTRENTQWGENVTHEAIGPIEQELCSNGWIHAYTHPYLAVLLNPAHAAFSSPILWEARGIINKRDGQMKVGCRKLTTVKRITIPEFSTNQRIAFGIYCALAVYKDSDFSIWAENWLSGKDRTQDTAARAAARAAGVAYAARAAYAAYAADAAGAAYAARAADAAGAARAAYAARAAGAAYAARAARAVGAADAADAAAKTKKINLVSLAKKAFAFQG